MILPARNSEQFTSLLFILYISDGEGGIIANPYFTFGEKIKMGYVRQNF